MYVKCVRASIKCNYCLSVSDVKCFDVSLSRFSVFFHTVSARVAALKTKWQDEKNQLLISNLWLKLVNLVKLKIQKSEIIFFLMFVYFVVHYISMKCIGMERYEFEMEYK